ncbi:hypothetical protein GCM10023259_058660 [Thermocatellispora tengchongensis]
MLARDTVMALTSRFTRRVLDLAGPPPPPSRHGRGRSNVPELQKVHAAPHAWAPSAPTAARKTTDGSVRARDLPQGG